MITGIIIGIRCRKDRKISKEERRIDLDAKIQLGRIREAAGIPGAPRPTRNSTLTASEQLALARKKICQEVFMVPYSTKTGKRGRVVNSGRGVVIDVGGSATSGRETPASSIIDSGISEESSATSLSAIRDSVSLPESIASPTTDVRIKKDDFCITINFETETNDSTSSSSVDPSRNGHHLSTSSLGRNDDKMCSRKNEVDDELPYSEKKVESMVSNVCDCGSASCRECKEARPETPVYARTRRSTESPKSPFSSRRSFLQTQGVFSDREAMLRSVAQDWTTLQHSTEFQEDREAVLIALRQNSNALHYASPNLCSDAEFMICAVTLNGRALRYAPKVLRADRAVVLAAVAQDPFALSYASATLRRDRDFVLCAVSKRGRALEYADACIRDQKDVVLVAVVNDGSAVEFASPTLRSDREIIRVALARAGKSLRFASQDLRSDRCIVLSAVMNDGSALEFASDDLRGDSEIVRAAVAQSGMALRFASAEMQADCEVVMCSKGGYALQFASVDLRDERLIVLSAVSQDGFALRFASSRLRSDKDIVLSAVSNDWSAFQFASDELRSDRNFVVDILAINWNAIQFVSNTIHNDPDINLIAQSGFALERIKFDVRVQLAAALSSSATGHEDTRRLFDSPSPTTSTDGVGPIEPRTDAFLDEDVDGKSSTFPRARACSWSPLKDEERLLKPSACPDELEKRLECFKVGLQGTFNSLACAEIGSAFDRPSHSSSILPPKFPKTDGLVDPF